MATSAGETEDVAVFMRSHLLARMRSAGAKCEGGSDVIALRT
jgi:hypothetical protein